ncbi:MAG: hypothetical protein OER21_03580 [Gemmatimonadota bacterium]|nr:hypothetical protein [Gemmatimonadota bacterium]
MNDDSNLPVHEGPDPALDRWLDGLGRFSPRQGFADRVVAQVRVPLPRWLRGLRNWGRGLVTGVTGWTLLAVASLATAATWGSMLAVGMRYDTVVREGVSISWAEASAMVRAAATDTFVVPAGEVLVAGERWLAATGLPVRGLLIAYGITIMVSAIVLWWLMAEPARTRV